VTWDPYIATNRKYNPKQLILRSFQVVINWPPNAVLISVHSKHWQRVVAAMGDPRLLTLGRCATGSAARQWGLLAEAPRPANDVPSGLSELQLAGEVK
jgi:hypothetical protein